MSASATRRKHLVVDAVAAVVLTTKEMKKPTDFVLMNGLSQFIDFPTRKANTLDLIISDVKGEANAAAHFGTSDHVSIEFEIHVDSEILDEEKENEKLNWRKAPWDHIRGEVKRMLKDWKPHKSNLDAAADELDEMLWKVVKRHVKPRAPTRRRPVPWWNKHCRDTYKKKLKAFKNRLEHPCTYRNVMERCKKAQMKAFRGYNLDLKEKLGEMEKSDKQFWELTKQISGLQAARTKSAPSAEELAKHFANKMSNGAEVYDNDWVPSENWRKKKTNM